VTGKTFLLGLVAVAALVVGASIYFRATVTPADTSVQILKSPDGRFKAVRIALSRSGASAFCYHSVSVLPSQLPDSFAESEKQYQVYFAPCAVPPDPAQVPAVQWLGNDALQITYTPGPVEFNNPRLRRRVVDASEKVRITYVTRQ
jgi:hypothetical protein